MKLQKELLIVLLFFLVDDLIEFIFPMDPLFEQFSFLSQCGFLSLCLISYHTSLATGFLFSALCGLIQDLLFGVGFPFHGILYGILGCCVSFLSRSGKEGILRKFSICFSLLVLGNFISFGWYRITGMIQVHFGTWFVHHELGTMVFNALAFFALEYIFGVMERYQTIRRHRIQRQEKRKYRRLRLNGK